MGILGWVLLGLFAGMLAKLFMPGDDPGGFIVTTLLGIAGAFMAYAIGRSMGWYAEGEPAGFLASVAGAILLLALYRLIVGRRVRV